MKILFRLSFALIGQFFLVYIHSRLSEQFSESQVGFWIWTVLEAQAAIRKPEQALWRGLLEGISQLVIDFLEASRNFILEFLHKKTTKKFENQERSFKKYCFEF